MRPVGAPDFIDHLKNDLACVIQHLFSGVVARNYDSRDSSSQDHSGGEGADLGGGDAVDICRESFPPYGTFHMTAIWLVSAGVELATAGTKTLLVRIDSCSDGI